MSFRSLLSHTRSNWKRETRLLLLLTGSHLGTQIPLPRTQVSSVCVSCTSGRWDRPLGTQRCPQAAEPAGEHQGQAAQGSLLVGKCWGKWGLGEGSQHLAAKAGQGGTGWRQDTGLQGRQGTWGNARGWAPSSGLTHRKVPRRKLELERRKEGRRNEGGMWGERVEERCREGNTGDARRQGLGSSAWPTGSFV